MLCFPFQRRCEFKHSVACRQCGDMRSQLGGTRLSTQELDPSRLAQTPVQSDQTQVENLPGALRGVVTLTLETRQAQRMVKGRPGSPDKPAIIGLIGFANLLRVIWHGARVDDPYADWWLVKVHAALDQTDQALREQLEAVEFSLTAIEAISVTPGRSVRPVRTLLRFSNPYAYRGAQLIAAYDRLVRTVLTAQHIGVMVRNDAERLLALSARQLRHAFLSPIGYRLTGITRPELSQETAKQAQAQASMGEVPAEILTGELRAPHAPVRSIPASKLTQHVKLQPQPSKS